MFERAICCRKRFLWCPFMLTTQRQQTPLNRAFYFVSLFTDRDCMPCTECWVEIMFSSILWYFRIQFELIEWTNSKSQQLVSSFVQYLLLMCPIYLWRTMMPHYYCKHLKKFQRRNIEIRLWWDSYCYQNGVIWTNKTNVIHYTLHPFFIVLKS